MSPLNNAQINEGGGDSQKLLIRSSKNIEPPVNVATAEETTTSKTISTLNDKVEHLKKEILIANKTIDTLNQIVIAVVIGLIAAAILAIWDTVRDNNKLYKALLRQRSEFIMEKNFLELEKDSIDTESSTSTF